MTPDGAIKLVSELLDLPLLDSYGKFCGIVDDVELDGGPGKPLKLKALLVGPGAYAGRLPGWAMGVVKAIAGERIVRVPIDRVQKVGGAVTLKSAASDLGLNKSEAIARRWIPQGGAL